ncbi:MAG: MotA/TolQ/ExbB proton channel family protein [Deltaproteobacteria bacterium]|nr:MotA/TolQ/ExbB proton channel family protein [Deltaproteobacteria bacterium]
MLDLFFKGGFAMYPLLALSVVTVAIAIERVIYLRRARTDASEFMGVIHDLLSRNALDEAYKHCESTSGPISGIIQSGLKNQRRGRQEVVRAIEDAGALEVAKLEKGILVLQTISKIAPLIGLFGTVTGMIRSFQAMGGAGGENPRMVAAGIAEALVATAGGLVVAIPAYFLSFYFMNKVGKFLLDMQKSSIHFLDVLGDLEEKVAERSQRLDTIGGDYLEV